MLCNASTSLTLDTSEVVTLGFVQGLLFGDWMKLSLINTTQWCYYGFNILGAFQSSFLGMLAGEILF